MKSVGSEDYIANFGAEIPIEGDITNMLQALPVNRFQ